MYDARFKQARNFGGKLYRNQQTGDLEQYCGHDFLIHPEWGVESKILANALFYNQNAITDFVGICKLCGELLIIPVENLLGEEEFEEGIAKITKEIGKEVVKKKKEVGNGISNNCNIK